jgi:hypothetical protein
MFASKTGASPCGEPCGGPFRGKLLALAHKYKTTLRNLPEKKLHGLVLKNFIRPLFMDFCNKLECLSLASLSSQVQILWVRPGAHPRLEHLKGFKAEVF